KAFESADFAKKIIRKIGYTDAFVVAFFDGKRIPLDNGLSTIKEGDGDFRSIYQSSLDKELSALNASAADIATIAKSTKVVDATSTNIASLKGLFYTIQIGVFSKPIIKGPLLQLQPLFRNVTSSGLMKYSSGMYSDLGVATTKRDDIRNTLVKDAYIVAYNNGGKVSIQEATNVASNGGSSAFAKMPVGATKSVVKTPEKKEIADHEVDANEVRFKVQIGSYKVNLTEEVASLFFKLAGNHGLDHYNKPNGVKVYTIGAFKKYSEASEEKVHINENGIADAFIVAFHGKKRISVTEAMKIIRGR
ncbi:MAG: hypothetical protein HRT72_07115, partial [Flavobacteriales bacterium]|nr:hypothetical protein [Flavobacteriales bacterium]